MAVTHSDQAQASLRGGGGGVWASGDDCLQHSSVYTLPRRKTHPVPQMPCGHLREPVTQVHPLTVAKSAFPYAYRDRFTPSLFSYGEATLKRLQSSSCLCSQVKDHTGCVWKLILKCLIWPVAVHSCHSTSEGDVQIQPGLANEISLTKSQTGLNLMYTPSTMEVKTN